MPYAGTPALSAATNYDPNPNKGLGDSIQTSGGRALIAAAGPDGTIADVASATQPDRISVYVVRKGDTLSDIADMFSVSINTILWANDLKSARDVHPGDTLIILPVSGIEHTVTKGETLKSLAKKFSGDAEEIAEFNGLDPASPLAVGSKVIIPGGEIAAPPAPVRTKKAAPSKDTYYGGGGELLNGFFGNPLPGAILTQGLHGWNGVDLGAAKGTPVRAAANGTAIISRNNGGWNGGYGNYVVITHNNGTQTLYSHMKSSLVAPGQFVSAGQVIGYVGMTGRTTGPHLHFEVRGAINPFRACPLNNICQPR